VIPVELLGIRFAPPSSAPFVVLREFREPNRTVMIYIGEPEALSIQMALAGDVTPRPMTHDLMVNVIEELGAELVRVVVTHVEETTFYAELHLDLDDEVVEISARPSDSLALAARTGCPVYVAEEVLDDAGLLEVAEEDADTTEPPSEEVVEEFRQFIDSVSPEDFGPRT